MMKFANCGSNKDYRYVKLPMYYSFDEDVEEGVELNDVVPTFIHWSGHDICFTNSLFTSYEGEDGETAFGAYYMVVDLRGCNGTECSRRLREANRIKRNFLKLEKEVPHPQFGGDEKLLEEAKDWDAKEFGDNGLLPFRTAKILTVSVPYISFAGGLTPEAKKDLIDMDEYEISEFRMPVELPWPADCWIGDETPPVGKKENVLLSAIKGVIATKEYTERDVTKAIAYLKKLF